MLSIVELYSCPQVLFKFVYICLCVVNFEFQMVFSGATFMAKLSEIR